MKLLQQIILPAFIIFCFNQSVTAQDTFTKFSERLHELNKKKVVVDSIRLEKKRKHVGKVKSSSTIDYSLLANDSNAVPLDTILNKRLSKRKREINSDSFSFTENNFTTDSIPKKKKKKKGDEYYSLSDSLRADSIKQQEFIDDKTAMSLGDTLPTPLQIIYMDSAYGFLSDNKFDTAISYYDKVINQFAGTDEFKFAFLWRSKAKMGLNDLTGALQDITFFIASDNCNSNWCSESYYTRGMINFKLSDYINATNDFSKVLTDSTYFNRKYCYFYRAFCLGETEKYIPAVAKW